MNVSKEIVELAEKIKKHRIDTTMIEKLKIKKEALEYQVKELEKSIRILKLNTIEQNRLLGQISELEKVKKKLQLDLERFKKSFTFIITTSHDVSDTVYGEISREVSGAQEEILICSPWITHILRELHDLDGEKDEKRINLKIITRLTKEDIAKGFMDLDKFRTLKDTFGAEIRFNNDVHAKMVIIDGAVAIISSANLTKRGLSVNYEAGISVKEKSIVSKVTQFFEDIWEESEPLTEQAIERVMGQEIT